MLQRVKLGNRDVTEIPVGGDKNGVGATCYSRVTHGADAGLFVLPVEVATLVAGEPHESWGKVELVGEPTDEDTVVQG
jgi:hypothetical protein